MVLLLLAALLASDPPGTVALAIEVGKTAPIATKPPANVICDDPAVVSAEFDEAGNGFVLRGHKPGSTLCGVWIGNQIPAGLYRVTVPEAKEPKETKEPQKPDAG